LNLENPSDLGEPLVEATGEAPTVVEIVNEPFVEEMVIEEISTGAEPIHADVEEIRTGAEPVLESVEMGTGEEPILADIGIRTGETPVLRAEASDSCFKDYPGDDFEKVGEITPEEIPQSPSDSVPKIPSEETPPALNQEGRGLRPWLGGRIYHGSESS